jgi:diguanylate cyclase (GGDEF)-like protein
VRALNQQSQLQAVTDDLTGLRNRRFMVAMLGDYYALRQVSAGAGPDMALLFVDLDHFKEVNDSFGHPVGDDLLRQLGSRLEKCVRASDVVARFGGDEFAIALAGVGTAAAIEAAGLITAELGRPFVLDSVKVRIGSSVGIAMASAAATTSELMSCADVAMYRAKQAGSGFAIYGEIAESAHAVQLVEELRSAIGNGQLVLHYQPLLDLHTGRVGGAEALLRWSHPHLGLVPPLEFLPLAEEAGLMPHITDFVLSSALRQVAEWRASGYELSVSVNISPGSLLEEGFVAMVQEQLVHNKLPAEALVLEITENVVIRDVARTRVTIEQLSALGLLVSIDDFGAGATSLAYLRELGGVGELKLDRSFVVRLCHAEQQRELDLVRATIDLGHAMGLRVVAEGIEDAETLGILKRLGCDLAQGYHISRPRAAEDLNFGPLSVVLAPA